ncbi:MAG: hypothetical protein PF518_11410 [Spirochaetaceae bacterium]|jgi:hypothetical protein|nr:hypothetical protein [Spirochaetaceae bacterium]
MRKIIWLITVSILVSISCATTPLETIEEKPEMNLEKTVTAETEKTVFMDVYLLSRETLSSSDGIVDGFIEYSYDEKGNFLEKTDRDGDRTLLSKMTNKISQNNPVKTQWFSGEENEPGIYIIREYSGMNVIKETSFDIHDIAQSISDYEYDNMDQLKRWTVSTGDNVPMMVTEYEYNNGSISKATFLTPLGVLEGYIVYSWVDGNKESEKDFDEDDNLERSVLYEYADGNLVKEIYYKKLVIDHTIEYELDENGNAIKEKYFYRSGNLKSQKLYEYISVKKEVQQ